MKYKDLKIVENVTKDIGELLTRPIIKYFTRNCNDEKRINQQLTNLRKNLAKYPEKRNPVVQGLSAYPVLARLVKGTVYPIQIAGSGFSTPEYKKEMCIKGKSQGGIGLDAFGGPGPKVSNPKDGTTTNGTKDGTTTNGSEDGNGEKTTGNKFGTEKTTFGNLLDNNDLAGALKFLDGNPAFEKAIGSKFRTDIQSALDAQEAKERNRLAQEKADKEAKEAQRIADEKAAKEAKEKADAAAEAKRIADAEEQKRLDAIEAERKAREAEIKRQEAELAKLEKEAEEARIAAEELKQQRIKAEKERIEAERKAEQAEKERIEAEKEAEGVEEFDWEDLQ